MEDEAAAPAHLRPPLSADYQPPETPVERKVADVWSRLFGIEKVASPFRVSLADPRAWNLKEHLLSVSLEGGLPANIEAFKAEILRHPGI
jgi:hypothetical protein